MNLSGVDVDLTAVFITYNSAAHIGRAVRSARGASGDLRLAIVVVDNNSVDETVIIARALGPDVTVVETGKNLGYSGGINVGRRHADPDRPLAILNPDLMLEAGALEKLVRTCSQDGVGVAVPRLLEPDGRLFHHLRREPTVLRALGDAFFGARWARRPAWFSDTLRIPEVYDEPQDVDWAGGAALVVSPECNRAVGEWDEGRYFLYSEETDFQARARGAGYAIRYVPDACAVHVGGASGQSIELRALMAVNRIRYFEGAHQRPATACFRAVVALHHLLRARSSAERTVLRFVARRSRWKDLPTGT